MKNIDWKKICHYTFNVLLFVPKFVTAPLVVPIVWYFSPLLVFVVGLIMTLVTGQCMRPPTFWQVTKAWLWPAY